MQKHIVFILCLLSLSAFGQSVNTSNWQKSTKIDSTWDQPGNPVVLRISNQWQLRKDGNKIKGINIQGQTALIFRGNEVEPVRGLYFYIHPSEDVYGGGDAYMDFDEISNFIGCINNFSQNKKLTSLRDSALVGMSYRTKGGLFFRMGSSGNNYIIGLRKSGTANEDISIELNDSELSEFKAKFELARQWAEKQVP